jgi:hypothetical protein
MECLTSMFGLSAISVRVLMNFDGIYKRIEVSLLIPCTKN